MVDSTRLASNSIFGSSDLSTYSGCDIIPAIYALDPKTHTKKYFALGDITTLTYSIHRDKGAVRTLGRANPKGFTRGGRTIAGSLVFSIFDRRALYEISTATSSNISVADALPGFDILLYFTNEYGLESLLQIYNVQIADEGQQHSVNDLYIENTMTYVAGDILLLDTTGPGRLGAAAKYTSTSIGSATDAVLDRDVVAGNGVRIEYIKPLP